MSTKTIGPHDKSGFGPADVLKQAEQGDEISLEIEVYDGPFIEVSGCVENVSDDTDGIEADSKVLREVYVTATDDSGVDLLQIDLFYDPNSAYVMAHDAEVLDTDGDWTYYEIDNLAMCELERADYEYRVIGCVAGHWRVTEWKDRDGALEDCEQAAEEWDGTAFERRTPGDDSTIQRKKTPTGGEWTDVTEEMIHVVGEEVSG